MFDGNFDTANIIDNEDEDFALIYIFDEPQPIGKINIEFFATTDSVINKAFKIYVNEGTTTYNSNDGDQIVANVTNNINQNVSFNTSNTYPFKKFKSLKIEFTDFGTEGQTIIKELKVFDIPIESLPSLETAKTWLGREIDTSPNYGGQLLSASLFDRQNENALTRLVPNHI